MDRTLRLALVAAALLAGGGVFYHFVIYLPRVEEQRRADIREREENRKSAYSECMDQARRAYDSNWAETCRNVASYNATDLKSCLKDKSILSNSLMGAEWCKREYNSFDDSPNCTLPGKKADGVNVYYKQAQERCVVEARLEVQQ